MRTCFAVAVALMIGCMPSGLALAQENSGVQRPVTQQEVDRLKRQIDQDIRSSVEVITDYHTTTGDLNNRLDFMRYGGRLNLKLGSSSAFHLTGTRTDYLPILDAFKENGLNLTAGIQTKPSESTELQLEAGATRFSTDARSINALASFRYSPSEQTHLYASASRSNSNADRPIRESPRLPEFSGGRRFAEGGWRALKSAGEGW